MGFVESWRHQLLIVGVAAIVMFTNLGGPRLWDRDEPRNAGCALEMQQRGDWVVPVFNAELRAHKPVLLYWLIMSAYAVFGVNEFAARFWSALLAVGTAWATYHIGRRLFDPRVGLWAGVALATSLMFGVAGRAATPDATLIFLTTLALLIYVLAIRPEQSLYFPNRWLPAAAMYAVMGLAVLAKGPVGFVLPTAVIGMFLLIVRLPELPGTTTQASWLERLLRSLRPFAPGHFLRTCWAMRPLTAIAVVGAVALPWYVWVGWRTDGAFLQEFFLEHNLGRAASSMEGHSGSLLFYPGAILIGFFPWSVFAVPVLIGLGSGLRRRDAWSAGYVLAATWIGVYVGLFSVAQTKLPSYVTPCYPALALLTGCFLHRWSTGRSAAAAWWPRLALGTLALVGLGITFTIPLLAREFLPGEMSLGVLGLIPLAGGLAALLLTSRGRVPAAAAAVAATALLFTTTLFGLGVWRVDRHQQNHVLLAAIDQRGGAPQVGAFGCLEPTWVFYGGRPITELARTSSGADAPAEVILPGSPAAPLVRKPQPDAAEFFGTGRERMIITTDQHWAELQQQLPPEATVLAECPLFLRSKRLLLVGLPPAARTARVEIRSDSAGR
jgi:4-amino-4-deoxy-L-arabinose transferase-like glycosyltransferase